VSIKKTYLTTDQFIKVYKSLSDEKSRELSKAWYAANSAANSAARDVAWDAAYSAAWYAADLATWNVADLATWNVARDADLAIRAKDKTTKEQFNILTHPWTSCGLSFYAEDWEAVLNPKVENKLLELLDLRQEDYGDPKDNFTAIGRVWGATLKIEDIPAFQFSLLMAQLKIQRIIANPYKKDSWDDLLGYLHHAQNLLPERDGE